MKRSKSAGISKNKKVKFSNTNVEIPQVMGFITSNNLNMRERKLTNKTSEFVSGSVPNQTVELMHVVENPNVLGSLHSDNTLLSGSLPSSTTNVPGSLPGNTILSGSLPKDNTTVQGMLPSTNITMLSGILPESNSEDVLGMLPNSSKNSIVGALNNNNNKANIVGKLPEKDSDNIETIAGILPEPESVNILGTLPQEQKEIENIILGPIPENNNENVVGPLPQESTQATIIGSLPEERDIMGPLSEENNILGILPEASVPIIAGPLGGVHENDTVVGTLPEYKKNIIGPIGGVHVNDTIVGDIPEKKEMIILSKDDGLKEPINGTFSRKSTLVGSVNNTNVVRVLPKDDDDDDMIVVGFQEDVVGSLPQPKLLNQELVPLVKLLPDDNIEISKLAKLKYQTFTNYPLSSTFSKVKPNIGHFMTKFRNDIIEIMPLILSWLNYVTIEFNVRKGVIDTFIDFYNKLLQTNYKFDSSLYPTNSGWQGSYWKLLHTTSFMVASTPNAYKEFSGVMYHFYDYLPCGICREEYRLLKEVVAWKILAEVDASYVIWELHNTISSRINKKQISYETCCSMYNMQTINRNFKPKFPFEQYLKFLDV